MSAAAAHRVAARWKAADTPWWQGMTTRERKVYQKANRKRPTQRTFDMLDALLPQVSAFSSFAELEKDMLQHGYLPTTKSRPLRKLLDSVGLPYYGVVPPSQKRMKKRPKVYVVVRRAVRGEAADRLTHQDFGGGVPYQRVVEFDVGVTDEALFEDFPWKDLDGLGYTKTEGGYRGRTIWEDTVFLKPAPGDTRSDIEDMKDQVYRATKKLQAAHPEVEIILKMRKGAG